MRHLASGFLSGALPFLAVAGLTACASSGVTEIAVPDPIDMQRGWRIFVYGENDAVVGVTALPQHPAGSTRPEEILGSIAGAFCVPVLDDGNVAAGDRLRGFCREPGRQAGRGRVVLAPGWGDATPPHPDCFIHCVCEGYVPRTDAQDEMTRESATGPCTNRLNCRLACPVTGDGS